MRRWSPDGGFDQFLVIERHVHDEQALGVRLWENGMELVLVHAVERLVVCESARFLAPLR